MYMLCIYMYINMYICTYVCAHIYISAAAVLTQADFRAHSCVESHEGLGGDAVLTPGEPCDGVHCFASVYAGQLCIIAGLEFVAHIAVGHLGCGMMMILIMISVVMQMTLCDE